MKLLATGETMLIERSEHPVGYFVARDPLHQGILQFKSGHPQLLEMEHYEKNV